MNTGVQHRWAPVPEKRHLAQDFACTKETGLNAVQPGVPWAWVELKPGELSLSDYDRLVHLVEKNELGVIHSAMAIIKPYWINREIPGSEMIDHVGRKVASSNPGESQLRAP